MKSNILRNQFSDKLKKISYEVILLKIVHILLGIASSKGAIFGNFYPFGISLAAATPDKYAITTIAGIIIGYFFSSNLSKGLWYVSLIAVILGVRWTLNEAVKIRGHSFFVPLLCFVPTFIMGIFINYSDSLETSYIFVSLTQSVITALFSYFFKSTFEIFSRYNGKYNINNTQFTCMMISFFVGTFSLSMVMIGRISVGRVIVVIAILLSSYYMGVYGGSIAGTAAGAIFSMSSLGVPHIFGVYAFGGMISGIFSKLGRFAVCGVFLVCSFIYIFQYLFSQTVVVYIYEILCGVIIFSLLPRRFLQSIREIFYNKKFLRHDLLSCNNEGNKDYYQKTYIFETMECISRITESIIDKMVYGFTDGFGKVCMDSIHKHCKKCNLNQLCWNENDRSTREYFQDVIIKAIRGASVKGCEDECRFKYRCNNIKQIIQEIASKRDSYIAEIEAGDRAKNLSDGILEKSLWVKSLLDYSSNKVLMQNEDLDKSERVNRILDKYRIKYTKGLCKIGKEGRMFVEIEIDKKEYVNSFGSKLVKNISAICDREMSEAVVIEAANKILVRISQKAPLSVNVHSSQHVFNNGELCGDCCKYFYDGLGNFSAVISDGMGTGGEAAVDGAFTSDLIESLIKLQATNKNTIDIANLSILGKSKDESLTAVDIFNLDLFCGKAEFVKAGAPVTLIYSGGKILKVNSSSLPIGILNQTSASFDSVNLNPGDWVLMMSDGVTDVGDGWVEEKFRDCIKSTPRQICEQILNIAIEKREKRRDDDITVVVINIIKS